jgi:hypothetical protein
VKGIVITVRVRGTGDPPGPSSIDPTSTSLRLVTSGR